MNIKDKIILSATGIVGTSSLIKVSTLGHIGIKQNSLLANICVVLTIICALPWIAYGRSKLFTWQAKDTPAWRRAVRIILSAAILIGPVITGGIIMWYKIEKPTDAWGGFGPAIMSAFLVFFSHVLGIILWAMAYIIQLWRNRWQRILTPITIAYYLLAVVSACKLTGQI